MAFAWSTVSAMPVFENEPAPEANVTSPSASPTLTNTPPLDPAAPGWMCAFVNDVPGGKPVAVARTSNDAAVTRSDASFVRLNVMVAVAEPPASLSVIGGTSLDGSSVAVNVVVEVADGD